MRAGFEPPYGEFGTTPRPGEDAEMPGSRADVPSQSHHPNSGTGVPLERPINPSYKKVRASFDIKSLFTVFDDCGERGNIPCANCRDPVYGKEPKHSPGLLDSSLSTRAVR